MAFPPEPFLSIDEFKTQYDSPLSNGQTAVAERLLRVVSTRILSLAPTPNPDVAQQVTFEVVRDLITYGGMEKLSSFQNITSRRQESGTFDEAQKLVDDYLSDRHKRLLGVGARPSYYFGD